MMQRENPAQGFSLFEKRTRFQKRPRVRIRVRTRAFEGRKCRVRFFALLRFSARKTAFFGSSFFGTFAILFFISVIFLLIMGLTLRRCLQLESLHQHGQRYERLSP